MPPSRRRQAFHPHVQSVIVKTGESGRKEAVRVKSGFIWTLGDANAASPSRAFRVGSSGTVGMRRFLFKSDS